MTKDEANFLKDVLGQFVTMDQERGHNNDAENAVLDAYADLISKINDNIALLPESGEHDRKVVLGNTGFGGSYVTIRLNHEYKDYYEFCLTMPTKAGNLRAYPSDTPDYPGVYIEYSPEGVDYELDLTYAEVPQDESAGYAGDMVNVYNYANVWEEDWTDMFSVSMEEAKKALNE